MATLEPLDEPKSYQTKAVKKSQSSTNFFIFVDYLFLLIFSLTLCYVLYKIFGF